MTTHEPIPNPKVTVSNATSTKRIARCHHCSWEYANTVKTDVEYMARYHRGLHRTGAIQPTGTP